MNEAQTTALNEKMAALGGKVICGKEDGSPVLITGVDLVEKTIVKEDNRVKAVLQLTGTARATLVSPQNPQAGAEPLPEPLGVVLELDVERDNIHISVEQLNQCLDLQGDDALVLDGEGAWLDRFDPESPKSVVPALREKGLYIKTQLKTNWENSVKYGDAAYYFNPFCPPKRQAASKTNLAKLKEQVKKKSASSSAAMFDQ